MNRVASASVRNPENPENLENVENVGGREGVVLRLRECQRLRVREQLLVQLLS